MLAPAFMTLTDSSQCLVKVTNQMLNSPHAQKLVEPRESRPKKRNRPMKTSKNKLLLNHLFWLLRTKRSVIPLIQWNLLMDATSDHPVASITTNAGLQLMHSIEKLS